MYKVEVRVCLNNRLQRHFWSFVGSFVMYLVLSATYLWDLYRTGFTIALVIHSLDSLWGLGTRGFGVSTHLQDFYRPRYPLG